MDRFQHTGGSGMEIYLALRTRHASPAPATGGAEKMAVAILPPTPTQTSIIQLAPAGRIRPEPTCNQAGESIC